MKEELQEIADKYDMELREVVEMGKKLLDKMEEELAEFEEGDTVMTPDGKGIIKFIAEESINVFWVEIEKEIGTLMNTITKKELKVYFEDEISKE